MQDAEACVQEAIGLWLDRRPKASLKVFKRAIELDPDDVDALYGAALMSLTIGRVDQAEALFSQVLSKRPNQANAMYHLGLIASVRKDVRAAQYWYRMALRNRPGHRQAARRLAALGRA